jgi:hypothetical protein
MVVCNVEIAVGYEDDGIILIRTAGQTTTKSHSTSAIERLSPKTTIESHSTSAIERLSPKTIIESRPTLAIEQMSSKTAIEPQSTPANQAEGQSDKRQTCP